MVALVFLMATASCGGYSSPTMPSTGGSGGNDGTPVSIPAGAQSKGAAAYAPNPVTVTAGSTVTWTNNDTVLHSATSDSGVFGGNIAPGAKYSYTFQTKGTYPYHCTQHAGMVGTVVVQ